MKKIQLPKNQYAIVDDEDFENVKHINWQVMWSNVSKTFYVFSRNWKTRKRVWLHRLIMKTPEDMVCDHIHHNGLDNRKSELRNVTYSQNSMNRKSANSSNTLGERNISIRENGRYRVRLMVDGKCVFNKTFKNFSDAQVAYKEASIKYHKEFH